MDDIKRKMIAKAKSIHGEISPPGIEKTFDTCFTDTKKGLMFWFNDIEGNTRAITNEENNN